MSSWLPWGSKPPPPKSLEDRVVELKKDANALLSNVNKRASELPPYILISSAFALGGVTALSGWHVYARYVRRVPNHNWVTPDILKSKRQIKGYVTSVGDSDGFRLYHTPGFGWRWPFKFRHVPSTPGALRGKTISVRLNGVDAPEMGTFGKPKQAFADESLVWLKEQIDGKFIYCQLAAKDQYGRVVGIAYTKPWYIPAWLSVGSPLSLKMAREGWAFVYDQKGAVYGDHTLEDYRSAEKEAQDARLGVWQNGLNVERPSTYKERHRKQAAADEAPEIEEDNEAEGSAPSGIVGKFKALLGGRR